MWGPGGLRFDKRKVFQCGWFSGKGWVTERQESSQGHRFIHTKGGGIGLLCARLCAGCFTNTLSFKPHTSPKGYE